MQCTALYVGIILPRFYIPLALCHREQQGYSMADTKKLETLEKLQKDVVDKGGSEDKVEEGAQREFSAPDLRVETVVVYLDRAEVCRSFKAKVKEGENELLVRDLSQCIDKDSIR